MNSKPWLFLRFIAGLIFIAFNLFTVTAQLKVMQQVPGLPSTEVYDLLTDSKGFLWIAHNGGVSKYDGINFTNYSNPQQTSLSVTGLLEDKYGRIWFNNFTGQIFYIQNGKMNLLSAYESSSEPNFPRMGLFKNMLVATTKKGLFICDLHTLKCHYEGCGNPSAKGTSSISILSDQIIAYGNWCWYIFKPGTGLKRVYFNNADTRSVNQNIGTLNVKSFRDTAFMFSNSNCVLYKLLVRHDSLVIGHMQPMFSYINTISVQQNGYLVNTVNQSIESPGNHVMGGVNLTSMAIDKQGHKWYGSLVKGLITNIQSEDPLKDHCNIPLLGNDVIRCLLKYDSSLLIGTQNGKVINYNPATLSATLLTQLPPKYNGVSYLKMLNNNNVLIGSSTKTLLFNIKLRRIERTIPYMSIKQVDTIDNSILFATTPGLVVCPADTTADYREWKKRFSGHFKGFNDIKSDQFNFLGLEQRARAVACLPKTKTIWTGLKNGLFQISKAGIAPFFYNHLPVYASCLTTYDGKLVAGTFNNGILVIDGDNIRHITTEDGLLANNILKIKAFNNNLWVYNSGQVQVFDCRTLKIVNTYRLPGINDGVVTDAEDINGNLYLANSNGLYKISRIKFNENYTISLNSIIVDGKDTGTVYKLNLNYRQNDVQFNLGVPLLLDGKNIVIKYRLATNSNTRWTYGKAGERNFRFESLMPGRYQFEAIAGRPQTGISGKAIKINLIIRPPWWKQWWALLAMALTGAVILLSAVRLYYLNLLSQEKLEFEKKLIIEKERQRISSDMHDDIGASLLAMRLYTGNIQQSAAIDRQNFEHVYEMMTDLSNKVREVIWRLDNKSDNLESLINFAEASAHNLFRYAAADIKISVPEIIPDISISSDKRHDIFLVIREALHNIIKHSNASCAYLKFETTAQHLQITIRDDGDGIGNIEDNAPTGFGMPNMKRRVKNLGGEMIIDADYGTVLKMKIPLAN